MANEYWLLIGIMEIFEDRNVMVVAKLWKYTNSDGIAHLMWMNFVICELYLNEVFNK